MNRDVLNEPPNDKTNKITVRPAKAQIDQSLRCAVNGLLRTQAFFMRTAKTGWMPRLICVFAGRTATLLVLSCRGSNMAAIRAK